MNIKLNIELTSTIKSYPLGGGKRPDKVKTIFKTKTRDTRINDESIWSPNLVTGKITKKMRNKPNFNTSSSVQKTINQSRPKDESTNNQSSIIDNQLKGPNLHKSSHKCLRNIDLQKYPHPALLLSTNPYGPGGKKNAKQSQFKTGIYPGAPGLIHTFTHLLIYPFIQNKPNFNPRIEAKRRSAAGGPIYSFTHLPKYAKRTQSQPTSDERQETKYEKCKTNPI